MNIKNTLAEKIAGKRLKYDEKARLRLKSGKISRGAFNRTLKQAKMNVIKAIYTIFLLGYLFFLFEFLLWLLNVLLNKYWLD